MRTDMYAPYKDFDLPACSPFVKYAVGHEEPGFDHPRVACRTSPTRAALRIGLAAALVAGLLVLLFIPRADADRGPVPTVSHVVQPGDTLWSLAEVYTPDTGDIRETVALIRAANGMSSGLLIAGDAIEVPVGEIPGGRSRTGGH